MSTVPTIFGVQFEGFERDMALELDMGLSFPSLEGPGAPSAASFLPVDGSLDSITGDVTLWMHQSAAASFEGAVPPHGDAAGVWVIPEIQDGVAVPGIEGVATGDGYRTISNVLMTAAPESQGRKAVGTDLFGYKLEFRIPCDEPNTGYMATIPDIIAKKFGSHQIQDPSVQIQGITSAGVWASGLSRQVGRRWDGNVDLDHIDYPTAHAIIKWLRAIRGGAVTFPAYAYGPSFAGETISVVVTKATLSHSNGLYWAFRLETTLATSTATKPVIWRVDPAYVVSGAPANIIIYGSGFDSATTVTVGGIAATVTAWTSGKLYVTIAAGTAGQYEVVATNAQGSGAGTMWRYDAGEITFGTGGSIVATTAVSIVANQLVGLNASGDAVLADSILGIVAVGYAATTVAAGGALQINQTGHATPVSGLTDGVQVFLGTAGGYAATPPSGATISQQVGIATATGVAVNCGDGATYL